MSFITKTEIKLLQSENPRAPVARGEICIANAMYIKFDIWPKQDGGYRIGLPGSRKNDRFDSSKPAGAGNRPYYNDVGCVNGEAFAELQRVIFNKLEEEKAKAASGGGQGGGGWGGGNQGGGGNWGGGGQQGGGGNWGGNQGGGGNWGGGGQQGGGAWGGGGQQGGDDPIPF